MAKRHVKWSPAAVTRFVKKAIKAREIILAEVDKHHVRLMPGNGKTGINCRTVSLLPVVDCKKCDKCKGDCYDLQHDVINKQCFQIRVENSAIHKADPIRYWAEIEREIQETFCPELRINVGGDLSGIDFECINGIGERNPGCDILFFSKNDDECNAWLDIHGDFVPNVKCIYSRWPGMEMKNPHNMPESHILWPDGSTTAPDFGAYFCKGNCSYCHFHKEGCWTLQKGEHVIFEAH